MMTNWYVLAILALMLLSAQRFLYKVAAEKGCSTFWTTFTFFTTVAVFSSLLFLLNRETIADYKFLFFIAFVNSASFAIATAAHIESLKYVSAAQAYSLIRLNVVLVVLFSVFYFDDRLNATQIVGIVLAVLVIQLLTRTDFETEEFGAQKRGLVLVFVSMLFGAVAAISSKFAALSVGKFAFISISYIFSGLLSLLWRNVLYPKTKVGPIRDALLIGFVMGILNLAGYYAFLAALTTGPLSMIAMVTGMHFVVAIVLSYIIYKESLTVVKAIGVVLTVISVILLKG
jgi:drug/metabolite transporter (DMT)-like permease